MIQSQSSGNVIFIYTLSLISISLNANSREDILIFFLSNIFLPCRDLRELAESKVEATTSTIEAAKRKVYPGVSIHDYMVLRAEAHLFLRLLIFPWTT